MPIEVGTIEGIYRYPVKSMRGERLEATTLGLHGLEGDRRLAWRRLGERGGFPWLSASKLPELVLFSPLRHGTGDGHALPTHVLTPQGDELPIFGEALASDIGRRLGSPVEMSHLRHGVFDESSISVITSTTCGEVCRLADTSTDVRRFRPNILIRSARGISFEEDEWVGGMLTFGDGDETPAVAVTQPDFRCAIVNVDPDSGVVTPNVMKAVVRANQNNAGVYGEVTRIGRLAVGQTVYLAR